LGEVVAKLRKGPVGVFDQMFRPKPVLQKIPGSVGGSLVVGLSAIKNLLADFLDQRRNKAVISIIPHVFSSGKPPLVWQQRRVWGVWKMRI
jgi:hypothetical protein